MNNNKLHIRRDSFVKQESMKIVASKIYICNVTILLRKHRTFAKIVLYRDDQNARLNK